MFFFVYYVNMRGKLLKEFLMNVDQVTESARVGLTE